MNIKDSEVLIYHEGNSLKYTVHYLEKTSTGPQVVERPLNAQELLRLAKAGCVVVVGNTADTLSGVLKQIAGVREWGAMLPKVKFKICEFDPTELSPRIVHKSDSWHDTGIHQTLVG